MNTSTNASTNVIETHNLTKIYGSKYIALNGADLTVPQGSVFGLVGPNGAGKTTTIRLLLGLHNPTAGRALLFGEPMTPNAVHLRRRIGFLPTNPRFPGDMTPITYLDFVGQLSGLPAEVRKPRLAALLRAVGLLSASSQKVKSFSTGMTTRLGIAASLINDPELLIWDEPTAGLDPEGRKYTIDLIQELGQTKTILVSSHNLGDIKLVCDHIGILSEGKLIFNGPLREMTRFTRSSAIELTLDGDLDALCTRLDESPPPVRWTRERNALRLHFEDETRIAAGLAAVLGMMVDSGTTLLAINSLHDEMVDAFIRLLEEERGHGFSRILRAAQTGDGVPGAVDERPPHDG
ncbi:MAG: ABC transporter ATP-binding protein [Anaerolineae bacterium]|nr:ABC transporter ATP-binding protein [Anaerolineae bacterium]